MPGQLRVEVDQAFLEIEHQGGADVARVGRETGRIPQAGQLQVGLVLEQGRRAQEQEEDFLGSGELVMRGDRGGVSEARAGQPERRAARLVAGGLRVGRGFRLGREGVGDRPLEVALREQPEFPQGRRVGRGEELQAIPQEAGAMPGMLGRLGHHAGALRAGGARGVMIAEDLPEMRIEVGQATFEQLREFGAQRAEPFRAELPGGVHSQDPEPALDHAQIEKGEGLILVALDQGEFGDEGARLAAEVSRQGLLRIAAQVFRKFVEVGHQPPGQRGQDRQPEGLLRMLGERTRGILRVLADRQGREAFDHPGGRYQRRPVPRRQAGQARARLGQVADHLRARRLRLRQQLGRRLQGHADVRPEALRGQLRQGRAERRRRAVRLAPVARRLAPFQPGQRLLQLAQDRQVMEIRRIEAHALCIKITKDRGKGKRAGHGLERG